MQAGGRDLIVFVKPLVVFENNLTTRAVGVRFEARQGHLFLSVSVPVYKNGVGGGGDDGVEGVTFADVRGVTVTDSVERGYLGFAWGAGRCERDVYYLLFSTDRSIFKL